MYQKSKWITFLNKPAVTRSRMFCFPYAGGAAQSFKDWGPLVPGTTHLCAIQPPGRSSRFSEPLMTTVTEMVTALRREIKPFLDKPFVFFGHSLGAAVAYELARRLQEEGLRPAHIFVSGRIAPHRPRKRPPIHQLPENEFRQEMRQLNGTPPEILEHEELMDLMVPIVRADFGVSETYAYRPGTMLTIPLTAFGGEKDPDVDERDVAAWKQHTGGPFSYYMLPGDHFFINPSRTELLRMISRYLARL